jgi:hypothetical protein
MRYMFEVYGLVATGVFAEAGVATLTLKVWDEASTYVRARHQMRRIASGNRAQFENSRSASRTHDSGFSRVA